jgi:tellurite resistance protein TehA-like permease
VGLPVPILHRSTSDGSYSFHYSMYFHKTNLSTMTAAWLLPIVATIVAAASGGIVAEVLPNPQHALWTVIVSYVLWGTGVPLAMVVLVIYFQRLTVHNIPPREVIVSVFLPLGPLGQGGFGIMQLGKVAARIFPETHTLSLAAGNAGEIVYVMGWLTALIMWGFAIVWLSSRLPVLVAANFHSIWAGGALPSHLVYLQYPQRRLGKKHHPISSTFLARSVFPSVISLTYHDSLHAMSSMTGLWSCHQLMPKCA